LLRALQGRQEMGWIGPNPLEGQAWSGLYFKVELAIKGLLILDKVLERHIITVRQW